MGDVDSIIRRAVKNAVERSVNKVQHEATSHHRFTSRTGMLERSVRSEVSGDTHGIVYLDEGVAKYGVYVHEGTRPHVIKPRNKTVLRWPGKGGFVFSKIAHHPGTKPDQFLYEALDDCSGEIDKIFDDEIDNAVSRICDSF